MCAAFERLTCVRTRFEENLPARRFEIRRNWLEENVEAGRIVTKSRNGKRFFLVLSVFGEKVVTMRDDGQGATLSLAHIGRIYAKKYAVKEESLEKAFDEIHDGKNPLIEEPKISDYKDKNDDAVEIINRLIDLFVPQESSEDAKKNALGFLWEAWNDADFLQKTERDIETLKSEIWIPFENRARGFGSFRLS